MPADPIPRANFVDQAYGAIKQLIIGGELRPGEQLKIEALSRWLGVSSSPIREALRRLENELWIETIPFRGAFVRPLDEAELVELYEFREIIELAALKKLMQKKGANAGFLTTLARILSDLSAAIRAGDGLAYLQADARFHQTIVDMSGNRRLSQLFATLVEQGRSFMLGRTPEAMKRYKEQRDEHAELLDRIRAGDQKGACRVLKEHLRVSLGEIRGFTPKADST